MTRLARAHVWRDQLAGLYRLKCATGDASGCEPGGCAHKAGRYLNEEWDRCPIAESRRSVVFQSALMLDRSAQLSPIQGWPDRFAAWAWEAWAILRAAQDDRTEHAIKR